VRPLLLSLLLACASALVGCEDAQAVKAEEAKQKLVGTWLREISVEGAKGRRVLVLAEDGKFTEILVAEFGDGRKGRNERSGEWAFDGTNLKRRYTHEDGRQLSGNFHFVTFEIVALSRTEFEGKNHVQGEEIRYRKVPAGTSP
jgi:hypothetical protein